MKYVLIIFFIAFFIFGYSISPNYLILHYSLAISILNALLLAILLFYILKTRYHHQNLTNTHKMPTATLPMSMAFLTFCVMSAIFYIHNQNRVDYLFEKEGQITNAELIGQPNNTNKVFLKYNTKGQDTLKNTLSLPANKVMNNRYLKIRFLPDYPYQIRLE